MGQLVKIDDKAKSWVDLKNEFHLHRKALFAYNQITHAIPISWKVILFGKHQRSDCPGISFDKKKLNFLFE